MHAHRHKNFHLRFYELKEKEKEKIFFPHSTIYSVLFVFIFVWVISVLSIGLAQVHYQIKNWTNETMTIDNHSRERNRKKKLMPKRIGHILLRFEIFFPIKWNERRPFKQSKKKSNNAKSDLRLNFFLYSFFPQFQWFFTMKTLL